MTTRYNAIHNVTNPHQGDAKKVLCVCSAGLLRSPTMANVLHKHYAYNTRACGVHDYALILFDDVLGIWAEEIVLVNPNLKKYIPEKFKDKIICLDIPDSYEYMNRQLQEIILESYESKRKERSTHDEKS